MTVQLTSPVASFSLFKASKQVQFLETLKRIRFSGQVVLTGAGGQQWLFFLSQGGIIYATGGTHPVRRWQRNVAAYCPQMAVNYSTMQRDLAGFNPKNCKTCWQYQLLSLWIEQQKITTEQAAKLIQSVVREVLFDVAQAMRATYQIQQDNALSTQLILIDIHQAIAEVDQLWQVWHNDQVGNYSPNLAPVIKQTEQLRERTSAPVYQILIKILDGQHTLRDVGVQMKRDVLQITRSLLPYIQWGVVELINIPDLPTPVRKGDSETPATPVQPQEALIACVDDSPLVCKTMEKLLTASGYRCISVEDGLRAIAILLAKKPDLIFLDLVMPNTNGYEICSQLRKLYFFRNTPIVILTGHDGIVDRVRAKLMGASDFLSKPIDAGVVLNVIHKHLVARCH